MEPVLPTTPFGRRTLSLGHVASQMVAKERPPEAAAQIIRRRSEQTLFHPHTKPFSGTTLINH